MAAGETVLFTPIRIGALELPGRLFKTATAETCASADGFVTDEVVEFYRLIAMGGTPLIITGNIYVSRQGKSAPRQLGADDDKIAGLTRITEVVHAHGGRIFAQLNHCGRQVVPDFVGATDVPMVRGSFDRCLRNMLQGSMAHLPPWRRTLLRVFRPLVTLACNLLWKGREGFNLIYTPDFKARLRIPVISVGGFRTRQAMEAAIERGLCDAVSAGRPFLADPFFYRHLRDGTPGPRCVDCNACVGHLGAQAADCYHPRVRAEKDAMLAQVSRAVDNA